MTREEVSLSSCFGKRISSTVYGILRGIVMAEVCCGRGASVNASVW